MKKNNLLNFPSFIQFLIKTSEDSRHNINSQWAVKQERCHRAVRTIGFFRNRNLSLRDSILHCVESVKVVLITALFVLTIEIFCLTFDF